MGVIIVKVEYTVVRSRRKSIAISVRDGKVIVKAPMSVDNAVVESVVEKHKRWIANHLEKSNRKLEKMCVLSPERIRGLKAEADIYFRSAVESYSKIMGLNCGRVRITSAEHRYGSCNSKGNICFSYRLMLYPEAAREYVVVHELAHLIEMNHSPRFYKIIEKYMPDYKQRKKLLD